jgi:hypothetical protein
LVNGTRRLSAAFDIGVDGARRDRFPKPPQRKNGFRVFHDFCG